MNRGSLDGVAHEAARMLRFNEAPIHESGKSGITSESLRAVLALQ